MREKENNKSKDNFGIEKNILSLDLGTITGWAIRNEFGITNRSAGFKQDRFHEDNMRYLNFQRWLTQLPKIDLVSFEEVRKRLRVDAAHSYGEFLSNLTPWRELHKIPYQGIPVGTIKKFITGKGNANKAEVILAVKAFGYNAVNNNEADSLALLHSAMQKISPAIRISGGKI